VRSLSELSVRSLRRRPARFALTGAGAALGVAVLYAVLITSGATTEALEDAVAGSAGKADVFVGPVGSYDATVPPGLVDQVAALDGVDAALGSVTFRSSVRPTEDGSAIQATSPDNVLFVVGTDLDRARDLRSFDLVEGALPAPDADEIVVARHIADDLDLATGDSIALATPSGSPLATISGILGSAGAGLGFQGAVGYTSTSTAQRMFGKGDVITGVEAVLSDGVDTEVWIAEHRDALGQSLTIQDADDAAAGFRELITAISAGLTLMSVIAVFVGGFLVFLTFSVAVAERTPTYGILRALGAQPAQVRRVVLTEAGVLGLVASLAGLVVGRLIAGASLGLVESLLALDLPSLGMPVGPAVAGVAVGVSVSLAAAWLPSRRASALGPVDAMRSGTAGMERPGRWQPRAAVLAAGIALGLSGTSVAVRGLSALFVLFAAVLLVPFTLRPVARCIGGATARLARGTGSIAVLHLVKERSRSAYTLALVMVVLAMLITVAGANTAMSRTLTRIIDRQAGGSVQVIAPGAFEPDVGGRLAEVEGARAVTPVRFGQTDRLTDDGSRRVDVTVIDPDTYFDVAGFAWVDGDDETAAVALAAGGAVLLPDAVASADGLDRGDVVRLRTSEGVAEFTLAGTYAVIGPGFGVVAATPDAQRFGAGRPNAFLVDAAPGIDPDTLVYAVATELGAEYDLVIDTPASTKEFAFGQLRGFFSLAYVILVAAAVAGLLGLANTLAVSVLARTHEIGVLRSAGTLRRQIRQMVLVEAVTLALAAFVLALPLGLLLTLGTSAAFRGAVGASIELTLPWAFLPPLLAATLIVAAVAALVPARRAGRLEPVAALRFD
jgi:putative ABC transport system permease protein